MFILTKTSIKEKIEKRPLYKNSSKFNDFRSQPITRCKILNRMGNFTTNKNKRL